MALTDLPTVKNYLKLNTTNSDAILASLINSSSQDFLDETGRQSFDAQTYTEVRDGQGTDFMQLTWWPVNSIASLQIDSLVLAASNAWNSPGYQFDMNGKVSLIGYRFCLGRRNVAITYNAGYPQTSVTNELQTIPSGPGPYTIQVMDPLFLADAGVKFFVGGAALTPVSGAPAAGQYYVTPLGQPYAGLYLFNSGDAGKQVQISYTASGIPSAIIEAVNEMVALRYRDRDHIDTDSMSIGETTTKFVNKEYPLHVQRVMKKYKRYLFGFGF